MKTSKTPTLETKLAELERELGLKISNAEWDFIADMRDARAKGVGYGWMQQVIEWEWQYGEPYSSWGPESYQTEIDDLNYEVQRSRDELQRVEDELCMYRDLTE